jgi:hypothetical protein
MAAEAPNKPKVQFCSTISAESGESTFGSAWHAQRYILSELPLPWKYNVLESPNVPPGLLAAVQRINAEGIYPAMIGFAPDEAWSVAGHTRVIDYSLPEGAITAYQQREYLFPTERMADIIEPFLRNEHGQSLDEYLVTPPPDQRDLFVCTHGAIDACCATFGYPTYKLLRHMASTPAHKLRVWRCTHFGGHRFASTMFEMPAGRYWGHLEARDLGPIVRREATESLIRSRYRGWAALPYGAAQIAECELFARIGWEWLYTPVVPGEAPPHDWENDATEPQTMTFDLPDPTTGVTGHIEVTVSPNGSIRTTGSSGAEITWLDVQQFTCEITAAVGVKHLLGQ